MAWRSARAQRHRAMTFSDRAAQRLRIAGALLQSKGPGGYGVKIAVDRVSGENYPTAVLRTLQALSPDAQAHMRALIDWVEDYQRSSDDPPTASTG